MRTPGTTFPKRSLAVTMIEFPVATAEIERTFAAVASWKLTVSVEVTVPAVTVNTLAPVVQA